MQRIILALCIVITVAMGSDSKLGASTENKILELLEEFRLRMCHPIPKLGLPALDPLQKSSGALSINNAYLKNFEASMENFQMNGLSDFVVNDLKISGVLSFKFEIDISFPATTMSMKYKATGSIIDIIFLDGDDHFEGEAKDLRLKITGSTKVGTKLGIKNLKIQIKMAEIFVDFGKLVPDDRVNGFIHSLINNVGIELMDDLWKQKNEDIETQLETAINVFLSDYTLKDITNIITGGGGPIFGPEDPLPDCKDNVSPHVILIK